MKPHQIAAKLEELDESEQVLSIITLAAHLTIAARDTYPAAAPSLTAEQRLQRMQGFNELQHQLLQHAASSMQHRERYPIDVFCAGLFELAETYDITQGLRWAIGHTRTLQ